MKKNNLDFFAGLVVVFLCYLSIDSAGVNAAKDFNTTRSNRDRSAYFTVNGDFNYCKSGTEKSKTDYEYKPQKADCATVSKETSVVERHNWLCKYDPEFCAFFGIPPILD